MEATQELWQLRSFLATVFANGSHSQTPFNEREILYWQKKMQHCIMTVNKSSNLGNTIGLGEAMSEQDSLLTYLWRLL